MGRFKHGSSCAVKVCSQPLRTQLGLDAVRADISVATVSHHIQHCGPHNSPATDIGTGGCWSVHPHACCHRHAEQDVACLDLAGD